MEDKDAAATATAPAAAPAKLTLLSLPPEIVLCIVEWVERIVRADKVRQEEEDGLLDNDEGANGEADGEDEMMFQMPPQAEAAAAAEGAAPEANIGGAGIGGAGFLNNLFGWAIGGGGGGGGGAGNAGAAAAVAAPQGNAANLGGGFAAVNVGPQPAGLAGLMQALGGQPGQGMPTMGGHPGADSADSDDEMPRECLFRYELVSLAGALRADASAH